MDNSLLEGTNIQKYVYPSESCAKKSQKYIFTHKSSSTWINKSCLVVYVITYPKSKYACLFQMLGVGQRTILEHHILRRKFVLKVECIAIFIYQNDYYNRINQQLYHILSKKPIFKVTLSKQKVNVSPTRNEIHSNTIQIPSEKNMLFQY